MDNIKVVEGNEFALLFPLKRRTFVADKPIDEDIDCTQLVGLVVKFGGAVYAADCSEEGVRIVVPASVKRGVYDVEITAEYQGANIRAAYFQAVTIVEYNEQSNAEEYVQGSPVVAPAAYVIGGAMTDEELELLKAEYRERIGEAEQAKAEAEQAKAEYIAKAEQLDDVAQQTTLLQVKQGVDSIGDLAPTVVSQQATIAALTDEISTAAEAYNTGKVELAENLTTKGVPASSEETLPALAGKVLDIATEEITIDGGEMYSSQIIGTAITAKFWNLYEVLGDLLSDGRLSAYGGIVLAQVPAPDEAFILEQADAYVVSELDNTGEYIMYTGDTTHTWNREWDGRLDKWVAYCFLEEWHSFNITNNNVGIRDLFIGRNVGTIGVYVNTYQLGNIVVPQGNMLQSLAHLAGSAYTRAIPQKFILRMVTPTNGYPSLFYNDLSIGSSIYMDITRDCYTARTNSTLLRGNAQLNNVYVRFAEHTVYICIIMHGSVRNMVVEAEEFDYDGNNTAFLVSATNVYNLTLLGVESFIGFLRASSGGSDVKRLNLRYRTNDKSRRIYFTGYSVTATDIELQDGWCKPLNVHGRTNDEVFPNLTEDNIVNHILRRLKQDEPNCGSGVEITLGALHLSRLTSQEAVQLLDDLTNIYGYTFS